MSEDDLDIIPLGCLPWQEPPSLPSRAPGPSRKAVEGPQGLLVEVRSSVLVLRLSVQLCHPDGHSCLSQQVQALLRTKGLTVTHLRHPDGHPCLSQQVQPMLRTKRLTAYITPSPRWALLPEPANPAVDKRVNCYTSLSPRRRFQSESEVQVHCCSTSTETMLRTIRDGEPRTATSTFTQLLSSDWFRTSYFMVLDVHRNHKAY